MECGDLSEAFVSFQGEGLHVGRRQLFLRFAGCPLRCRYCDTPESLVRTEHFAVHAAGTSEVRPNPVSVADVTWAIERLGGAGSVDGVALTGGEPLSQVGFLVTLLRSGVVPRPRLLETAGTMPDALARVVDLIDVVSMDIKLPSNTGETPFWENHEEFLKVAGDKVYAKILVDDRSDEAELARATALLAEAAPRAPLFLQPITNRRGVCAIAEETLERLFTIARDAVADVRVVPQTHKFLAIR